ncbi:MAG: helix-turn-helix domain-containing protein [Pseudomonadota bacterium]
MQNAKTIALLLFPAFSNLGLANAVEPFRAANTLSPKARYAWRYLSLDGAPVASSSGLVVTPEGTLSDAAGDLLVVLPSYGHQRWATPNCLRALRAASRRFGTLAGVDTGAWLLAAAGLLDGRRATCHWDVLTEMSERFPEVDLVTDRFVVDGNRLSCGGATTTLDLMLHRIEQDHGAVLAHEVAALFMHGEPMPGARPTLSAMPAPRIRAAAALMRRAVEKPLPIPTIAAQLGLTRRALEQSFRAAGGPSPGALYRRIRLSEARRMIVETHLSVTEIAGRAGYLDPSALTRAFRAEFGATPQSMRRALRSSVATRAGEGWPNGRLETARNPGAPPPR